MKIRIITLYQPWATLAVTGHKKIETRGYNTKHRGLLLIHAGKDKQAAMTLATKPYFSECVGGLRGMYDLPFGAIVGAVNVSSTLPTEHILNYANNWSSPLNDLNGSGVKDWLQEITFGDYRPGRYGWFLMDAVQFKEPIPWTGSQGMSTVELADHPNILKQLPQALIPAV